MKKISIYTLILFAFFACKDTKKENMMTAIKDSEKKLLQDITSLDKNAAQSVIKQYEDFYAAFPKDTTSAYYLFKAGDLSRGIGEYGKAIKFWGDMREFFPDYRLTSDAMFLQAFTYEENLQDIENAKRYYQKFLEKYPNHPFAHVAQQELQVIDIPIDQLIKKFEEKNKNVIK